MDQAGLRGTHGADGSHSAGTARISGKQGKSEGRRVGVPSRRWPVSASPEPCWEGSPIHGAMHGQDHPPASGTAEETRPHAPANSGKKTRETSGYRIIVDLPGLLPVTEGELELLEAELADFIAELLKT